MCLQAQQKKSNFKNLIKTNKVFFLSSFAIKTLILYIIIFIIIMLT